MSRTRNSFKNIFTGVVGQFLTVVLSFLVRTVFIHTLSKEYLGINGLFTNILSVLSLAELGIGTSIVFHMYKPISENDQKKISALMSFYKEVYRYIGIIIGIIGLCLIPFLGVLIKDAPSNINIKFIFLLYIIQNVSSYLFFAYKKSLIEANQKNYQINLVSNTVLVVTSGIQIISLMIFHNYILYYVISILSTICQNIIISKICDTMYPYINKYQVKISESEKKYIFKDCFALSIYRINSIVLNATDNIILSSFIGLGVVALYSNYLLITKSIRKVIDVIFNSLTASIGNLYADNKNKKYSLDVFMQINYLSFIVNGIAAIGITIVINPFIEWWIGKDFLLSSVFVAIIGIDFYVVGMQRTRSVFRSGLGLFQQAKYRPLFGAIINVVLSIFLAKKYSIEGVVLATVIAGLLTYSWFDPLIILRDGFNEKPWNYYKTNISYFIVVVITYLICKVVVNSLNLKGFFGIIIFSIISVFISLLVFIVLFYKKDYSVMLRNRLKVMFEMKGKRGKIL